MRLAFALAPLAAAACGALQPDTHLDDERPSAAGPEQAVHVPGCLVTHPGLVISEVLANPAGSESTQEYVELQNLGAAPASLGGLRIEDSGGFDPLPEREIPAGAFVLLVAEAYEPVAPGDVPPAPEAIVVRVTGRIGRDGLTNTGEPVLLRAADGQVVSRYGGWIDVSRPAWSGRSVHRIPADACDEPAGWGPGPGPTPGW